MLKDDYSVEFLVAELREGSEEAANELVERYGAYIERVVRRAISSQIRPKFDSQDFVQAVWKSFFSDKDLYDEQVRDEKQLVRLLARIARNKIVDEQRRRTTLKYDISRERSINDSTVGSSVKATSKDPTPSQLAIAKERWRRLLSDSTKQSRVIARLRREGNTHQEIAKRLNISTKTVQRALKKLDGR